jgi:hypothetical protein
MMWVQAKAPVTPLAKAGSLFLVIVGAFIVLAGVIVVAGGAAIGGLAGGQTFGNAVAGIAAVFGVIILTIGVLHILSGIGAWRGAGIARVMGIILAILFGLISLAGAGGTTDPNGVSQSSGVVGWVVAIGYVYTAVVLIFLWKQKPAA